MQSILSLNLTTKTTSLLHVPVEWQRAYLGASSMAARLLYKHLHAKLNPLAPEAPLLFLTGPLTGTAGPAVGRFTVCAKSPATGLWGESNCGGHWGPELRRAGFDGLWITGRAASPVYLWIENHTVEIRPADDLWGLETSTAQQILWKQTDKRARTAIIGPAGEQGIPFASIMVDHGRAAGRTGMGAVMGSKNLKAIVVRGTGGIPLADETYAELRSRVNRTLREDNFTRSARELGTAGVADYADYLGEMPKKYFQSGVFEGAANVSGASMAESILTGVSACHACVIACGRVVDIGNGRQKGPEYETIVGFGPNLLIDDLAFITRMTALCDEYGLDVISLSNIIGLAFTLYERGVISSADTGGIPLVWGDQTAVEKLVHLTGRREGFGALLAEGSRSLARRFGAEELAVQVNGLEMAYHDPRGASGMALVYATSPRGACHNQSDYFMSDMFGQVEEQLGMTFFNRHDGAEKAANVAIHQNWRTVFNALVMCFFANVPPEDVLALVNAATGEDYTLEELLRVGERAWNLKRLINGRLGLTAANDVLPAPLQLPYEDSGSAGYIIPFEEMLAAYYQARGWDPVSGMPTAEKRAELGLDEL